MTKGTVLDCRKENYRQSLQDLLQMWTTESVVQQSPKKVPAAQVPRAWDISNKSSANAKEGPDSVPVQNIHMPQAHGHRQAETD